MSQKKKKVESNKQDKNVLHQIWAGMKLSMSLAGLLKKQHSDV